MTVVMDGLASDGALAQAVEAGADAAHIPELFRSVEAAVSSGPVTKEKRPAGVDGAKNWTLRGMGGWVSGRVKVGLQRVVPEEVFRNMKELDGWWMKERMSRVVQTRCSPYLELDLVVVEGEGPRLTIYGVVSVDDLFFFPVLSHLVCASLTEDKYGVVQRDMPKIIEAMLSFLSAVEDYHAEIKARYVPLESEGQNVTLEELRKAEAIRVDVAATSEILVRVIDGSVFLPFYFLRCLVD